MEEKIKDRTTTQSRNLRPQEKVSIERDSRQLRPSASIGKGTAKKIRGMGKYPGGHWGNKRLPLQKIQNPFQSEKTLERTQTKEEKRYPRYFLKKAIGHCNFGGGVTPRSHPLVINRIECGDLDRLSSLRDFTKEREKDQEGVFYLCGQGRKGSFRDWRAF